MHKMMFALLGGACSALFHMSWKVKKGRNEVDKYSPLFWSKLISLIIILLIVII